MRWYRYSDHGEADRTGHLGWHANSGSRVGNGWQNFRHISGDIFGVHKSGDLRWYGYDGNGERDQAGARLAREFREPRRKRLVELPPPLSDYTPVAQLLG